MFPLLTLIRQHNMIPTGCHVLCALSGGMDSVYLFHRLFGLQEELDFTLHVAHFDHQLRGDESQRDADFVQALVAHYGLTLQFGTANVAKVAKESGRGMEETARQLRYDFLEETAAMLGCDRIATGHHADDNAETLLLHLVRGCGLQGLTGIAPVRGNRIRPLLTTSRATIEAECKRLSLPYVTDSTNGCDAYSRNKLRLHVLPILKEINPNFIETTTQTLGHLRSTNDYVNDLAKTALGTARPCPIAPFKGQPKPLALAMVAQLLQEIGLFTYTAAHLEGILAVIYSENPSAQMDLPQNWLVRRNYDLVELVPQSNPPALIPRPLPLDTPTDFGDWTFTCTAGICPPTPDGNVHLTQSGLAPPFTLRTRQIGDKITLKSRPTKTLKTLFIDEKLPKHQRDTLPLVATDDGVLYIPGFGFHAPLLAQPGALSWVISAQKRKD